MKPPIIAVGGVIAALSLAAPATSARADSIRNKQWHLDFLNVAQAHRLATGKGVTVAVIDSGVSNHPDLSGSVINGVDFVKKGQNGRTDNTGHGTGMAGLIAGHGKSGNGVLG